MPVDIYPGATKINFLGQVAEGQVINKGGISKAKGGVIDGFVKGPQNASVSKERMARPATATARGLHQRGQKAQTLVRGALKKPSGQFNKIQNLRPGFNPQRELRAKQTAKHSKIERFGGFVSSAKSAEKDNKEPLLQGEVISRSAPKKADSRANSAVLPSMVASASHAKLERMLDEALTKADAHKQAMRYQAARHFWQKPGFFSKKRWTKISILLIIVLGASLFVAWQKVPELSVKLAGIRAHVDASIPGYKPAGYGVSGPVQAANHAVTIQYASTEDKSKVYTINEQPSNQDSVSLIADNSAPGQQVQTAEANGIPIVIIKNKAMCVSDGLKRTVVNKADLSNIELLNIAKSACS